MLLVGSLSRREKGLGVRSPGPLPQPGPQRGRPLVTPPVLCSLPDPSLKERAGTGQDEALSHLSLRLRTGVPGALGPSVPPEGTVQPLRPLG